MKRGKRFIEDNNIYIYMGTVIFFILAIALGIIMYMFSRKATKLENNAEQIAQEQQIEENTENVSTEIGKTVEEAEKDTNSNANITTNETTNETTNVTPKETNTNTKSSKKLQKNKQENKQIDEPDTKTESNNKAEGVETKKEITFVKPVEGEIICEFAKDNLIYSETLKEWITHTAVDIKADKTSVIKAAADGIVRSIVNDPRYGLTVIIEHDDGYETIYSNLLTAEFVVEGEEVKQGQTIGTAGNTAAFESEMECHLHFEMLKDGEYVDPSIYIN